MAVNFVFRVCLLIELILTLSGCALFGVMDTLLIVGGIPIGKSTQDTTLHSKVQCANAVVSTGNYQEVFASVLRVVVDAGLVVKEIDKENGSILAEGSSSRALTWEDPTINIFLSEKEGGVDISLKSTVHGQKYDWGTSKRTLESFCSSLEKVYPRTTCNFE